MLQLHSSPLSWCVAHSRLYACALPVYSLLLCLIPVSSSHSDTYTHSFDGCVFRLSRCVSGSVQAERDASLSDLRARLVCVAVLCSAWCFVSRPLVSLVMPLSIRGSKTPCWMPLARSSVMLARSSVTLARSSVTLARSSVMLAQRYVKRVTLLSNSDRIW